MDLNCDLGEGALNDTELMPYITSCSIACGGHFGDQISLKLALELAKKHRVKVGAHPSYPDLKNFGRHSLSMSKKSFQSAIRKQLQLFKTSLDTIHYPWHHIKPHGALYNDMAKDKNLTLQFLEVVLEFPEVKKIYCMAGQPIVSWVKEIGLIPVAEAFADRAYTTDGTLVSRKLPYAVLDSIEMVKKQLVHFQSGYVESHSGNKIPLTVESICVHSDTPQAPTFVKQLYDLLNPDHV